MKDRSRSYDASAAAYSPRPADESILAWDRQRDIPSENIIASSAHNLQSHMIKWK